MLVKNATTYSTPTTRCKASPCELVSITADERNFVRRVPNRRVVRLGHADHESERVLMEEPGRFQVIERF